MSEVWMLTCAIGVYTLITAGGRKQSLKSDSSWTNVGAYFVMHPTLISQYKTIYFTENTAKSLEREAMGPAARGMNPIKFTAGFHMPCWATPYRQSSLMATALWSHLQKSTKR